MHTTCPECSSVFRVTAEHLAMARGQVRCGFCHIVFDALSHLEEDWKEQLPSFDQAPASEPKHDPEPAPAPAPNASDQHLIESENLPLPDELEGRDAPPDVYEDHTDIPLDEIIAQAPENENNLSEEDAEPSALSQLNTNSDDDLLKMQLNERTQAMVEHLQTRIDNSRENEVLQEPQLDGDTPAFFQPDTSMYNHETEAPSDDDPVNITYPSDVALTDASPTDIGEATMLNAPPVLREELAAARQESEHRISAFWIAGIIILSAVLLFQATYIFRNDLAKNDAFRGMMTSLCQLMSCTIPLRNDARDGIKTMKMVSHAITKIPQHSDQLRLRAIFTNTARYTQTYPVLSIRLSDETGKTTAMRYLRPQEYLASHINPEQGLQSGTAVEVILDFMKPKHEVLSYRFDFL